MNLQRFSDHPIHTNLFSVYSMKKTLVTFYQKLGNSEVQKSNLYPNSESKNLSHVQLLDLCTNAFHHSFLNIFKKRLFRYLFQGFENISHTWNFTSQTLVL